MGLSQWIFLSINICLESGETVNFFEGFDVPVDWDESIMKAHFSLDVTVDAVQSKNFVPN